MTGVDVIYRSKGKWRCGEYMVVAGKMRKPDPSCCVTMGNYMDS